MVYAHRSEPALGLPQNAVEHTAPRTALALTNAPNKLMALCLRRWRAE
jgi:hypothetical protein